jgi:hypothetical protein
METRGLLFLSGPLLRLFLSKFSLSLPQRLMSIVREQNKAQNILCLKNVLLGKEDFKHKSTLMLGFLQTLGSAAFQVQHFVLDGLAD